jgi:hypothetical protein
MTVERVAEGPGGVYEVPAVCLERYADLLFNFALGGGSGINPGDVVELIAPEGALPLYAELSRAVWRARGHVLGDYRPDEGGRVNLRRDFFEIADDDQPDARGQRIVDGSFLLCFNAHESLVEFVAPDDDYAQEWSAELDTNEPTGAPDLVVNAGEKISVPGRSLLVLRKTL